MATRFAFLKVQGYPVAPEMAEDGPGSSWLVNIDQIALIGDGPEGRAYLHLVGGVVLYVEGTVEAFNQVISGIGRES